MWQLLINDIKQLDLFCGGLVFQVFREEVGLFSLFSQRTCTEMFVYQTKVFVFFPGNVYLTVFFVFLFLGEMVFHLTIYPNSFLFSRFVFYLPILPTFCFFSGICFLHCFRSISFFRGSGSSEPCFRKVDLYPALWWIRIRMQVTKFECFFFWNKSFACDVKY